MMVALRFSLVSIKLLLILVSAQEENHQNAVTSEAERTADSVGFEAIARLHKEMDDDHSGSIDMAESTDFVQEELAIQEKDKVAKRQEAFHLDDQQISVEDLWTRWVASTERNWTVVDTINWLVNVAELPEYTGQFEKNQVNGRTLPRIADPNGSFILSVLGISNPIHRQKLQLKALDVVLFGYKTPQISYTKDLILVSLLVMAIFAYYMTASKSKATRKELQSLAKHMEYLKSMETEFVTVQQKLEEERSRQCEIQKTAVHHENENKEQIECLKTQLLVAEKQLEVKGGCVPLILQPLLKKTYECEMARINAEKKESLREMQETKEMVEKLRKKQSSIVNQFRVAHLGSDELDLRMAHLRARIHQTAAAMEECQFRWSHIERICGFNVMSNSPTPSGGAPPPAFFCTPSFSGLSRLPAQLSSATIAVPNAYHSAMSRPSLISPRSIDDYEIPPAYPYNAESLFQVAHSEAVISSLHHPAYLSHLMPIRSAANLSLKSPVPEDVRLVAHSNLPSPQKGQPQFGLHDDDFNFKSSPNLPISPSTKQMSSSVDQLFNDVTFSEDESLSASCENLLDENGKVKGLKEENGSVALSDASGNGVVKKKKKNIFSGFKIKSKTPKDTTKK